jgi:prepilin-type N-terminal cleavage/methylation domain-containing protein
MSIAGSRGGAARRRTAGFTLVQLMLVVAVIGILAAAAISS